MKIKISEATPIQLDWLVAKAQDSIASHYCTRHGEQENVSRWHPTTSWSQGGPIIEREGIEIRKGNPLYFPQGNERGDYYEPLWLAGKQHGPTALIAAMRCYIASKLGDTVEVPEELL